MGGPLSWLAASYSLYTHGAHIDEGGSMSVAEDRQNGAKMLVTKDTQGHRSHPCCGFVCPGVPTGSWNQPATWLVLCRW